MQLSLSHIYYMNIFNSNKRHIYEKYMESVSCFIIQHNDTHTLYYVIVTRKLFS